MAKQPTDEEMQKYLGWYDQTRKHWRSWGSWFSWGSPVGLGLFLVLVAAAVWILHQVF